MIDQWLCHVLMGILHVPQGLQFGNDAALHRLVVGAGFYRLVLCVKFYGKFKYVINIVD